MAKKIVLIMNCQGREMARYLASSFSLSCQYDFVYVSNIVAADDDEAKRQALHAVSTAHVVICQNVSSVEWLQNDFIAQQIPKHCRLFRFCFWRFYGYWPIAAEKFHPQMWYLADEISGVNTLKDYLQTAVPRSRIVDNFEEQVEKFAYLERGSELKMLPFFLENYRTYKLFTDEWHPTSMFFHRIAAYVLEELGFANDIALLPDTGSDNHRHRLVYDAVTDELGLSYDQNLLNYYAYETDRETFFEYCKHVGSCFDRNMVWTSPDHTFREWCYIRNIDDIDYEVSRFGLTKNGSVGPRRGWIGRKPAARPDSAWSIDLREYRQVRSLDIRLKDARTDRGEALAVMASTDGVAWKELTTIHDVASEAGQPLTLAFREPVLARHIGLRSRTPSAVDTVKIYTRAVSLAHPN